MRPSNEAILYALAQRQGLVPNPQADALRAELHPKQLAYIVDPSKAKALLTGRRFGKTSLLAVDLLDTALRFPGSLSIYIHLTHGLAKKQMGAELARLDAKHNLGMDPNLTDLAYRFPNGSQVWLGGANDQRQIEKYRGFKPHKVQLDESASFGPHIKALIEEVIDPGLMDNDGAVGMAGTPGPICAGMFYDATTDVDKGFSVHRGTVLDNTYLPNAAAWLAKKRRDRGWTETDPRYLREWMGIWMPDNNSLIYRYIADTADYNILPTHHVWEYVLGVDFGFNDATAFVILAFSRTCPDVYVVDQWQKSEMLLTDIRVRIEWLMTQYRFTRIVGDQGGLGKTFIEEFRQRNSIPMIGAEKAHKFDYIELLNSDLATGRLRVKRNSPLALEWAQLQWDDARKKEAPQYPNHLSDACLYAWREAKHFCYVPTDPPPTSREEALQREAEALEQRAEQRVRDRLEKSFWE